MGEDSISSSLEARQRDEVESISSIYGDIYTDCTPKGLVWNKKPSPHFRIYLEANLCADRPTISVVIDIEFTPTYPLSPPKISLVEPKSILNAPLEKMKQRVRDLLKEYAEEEVCFVIISDLKDMLDEFQTTTERVLSLEEEREQRLLNERLQLEAIEKKRDQERKLAKAKQNEELNKQIQKIRGEYYNSMDADPETEEVVLVGGDSAPINDGETNLIPDNMSRGGGTYFVFANTMIGVISSTSARTASTFKFKTVTGFVPYRGEDLLSPISKQYIVKPFFSPEAKLKIDRIGGGKNLFLLTEILLSHGYWDTDIGKREIQDLESELQVIMNIRHENINLLVGFQIDESKTSGWKIRLLTEFSSTSELIKDFMIDSGVERINLGMARTWLIQLIPGLEHLQNCGVIHKLLCPLTIFIDHKTTDVVVIDEDDLEYKTTRTLKLCHTSYGYRILKMLEEHPSKNQPADVLSRITPAAWLAPELVQGGHHQLKSDIWDLGVLFVRVILNYNILSTQLKTPALLSTNLTLVVFPDDEAQYADIVSDLFQKMIQMKPSKRPSPMELNAVKFLRDGPIEKQETGLNFTNIYNDISPTAPMNNTLYQPTSVAVSMAPYTTDTVNTQGGGRRSSMSYYDPQNNAFNLRNMGRYERDFEEVGKLGKGGFGEVVKARNRIEGTFYAIKKIKHRANKLDTLLSEVLSLARLNHQYIVRYYSTWVEEIPELQSQQISKSNSQSTEETEDESEEDLDEDSEADDRNIYSNFSRSTSYISTHDNSFQVDFVSNDPIIEFGYSTDENSHVKASTDCSDSDEEDDDTEELSTDQSISYSESEKSVSRPKSPKIVSPKLLAKSILYIQMEFCENNTLHNLIETGLPEKPHEYWRLFRQLLEAVSYIHREGFIHRDLKPMNIFIDKSNNIKVGDFGLAKSGSSQSTLKTEGLVVLKNNQIQASNSSINNKDWSTVVGTVFYTANEISTGNYDEKVDMYALGIIFFEMCWKLGTGMERAQTLNGLRLVDVRFPQDWKILQRKEERKVVKLLLDHNPQKRPSASEILSSGLLPMEHQDQIIKEALKSLADPSSPWQQQVRETLFNQPYALARDLMFDETSRGGSNINNNNSSDYLLFDKMIENLKCVFKRHGALEDFNQTNNVLLPKLRYFSRENVFEVLDRSGSILQLPYDLTLPFARYLSKNSAPFSKVFKHGFVYRQPGPNRRPGSMPDKYSAVSFDLVSSDSKMIFNQDAECLKVVDEIIDMFPYTNTMTSSINNERSIGRFRGGVGSTNSGATTVILVNHSDILNSLINFSFENVGIDERKRIEVIGVLSQSGIDLDLEQIKKRLREDAKVPHTVTKDLIDRFNFTIPLDQAKLKLQKAMLDSPHFLKVERALLYLTEVLSIFKKIGGKTIVCLNPLSNYNNKYYRGGLMFQVVQKVDRRKVRILSGGRYDSLVESFANKDMIKTMTPHAVGFQLSSTVMFLLLRKTLQQRGIVDGKWSTSRYNVMVTSLNQQFLKQCGLEILQTLWKHNISADIYDGEEDLSNSTMEEVLDQAQIDGCNWIVIIKTTIFSGTQRRNNRSFKPLRIRNLGTNKDVDVDVEELTEFLQEEIAERDNDEAYTGIPTTNTGGAGGIGGISTVAANMAPPNHMEDSNNTLSPLFSIDLQQKVQIVPNDDPRSRKNTKRDKWEIENDAKIGSSALMKSLANAPIISIDSREEVIDMILMCSLDQKDEFIKKVMFSIPNFPKSFAANIYLTLSKEKARGTRWVMLYSPKTQKTTILDLNR